MGGARTWAGLSIFLLLVSVCGAGIDRTGVITRFSSIVINGIELASDDTTVLVDGEPATPLDLSPGQYIRVREDVYGAAEHIEMDTAVRGEITSTGTGELRILNQAIAVDGRTVLEGITAGELVTGAHISVNGIRDQRGMLVAAWIEPADPNNLLLRGEVRNVALGTARATIGGQIVDFSAAQLEGFPTGMLAIGDQVLVRAGAISLGLLVADSVSSTSASPRVVGENASLEAYVTSSGTNEFLLGTTLVRLQGGTVIVDGDTSDLVRGARVVVDGYQADPETMEADVVTIKYEADSIVAGSVSAIDLGTGTLTVEGVEVSANDQTTLADQSPLALHFFKLDDLRVGDSVEVRGALKANGKLHAAVLVRTDDDDDYEGPDDSDSDEDSDSD